MQKFICELKNSGRGIFNCYTSFMTCKENSSLNEDEIWAWKFRRFTQFTIKWKNASFQVNKEYNKTFTMGLLIDIKMLA